MDSMIVDLQDIGFKGCGMRCVEPHYQEQNDHPLTYLVATFGLSLPATTVLACADKATLEELAMKVAEQQTKMKRTEDSAQELRAIRKELQEHRSQGQSRNHHSDVRLHDLQNQMADARIQLAKLECITVDPNIKHAEPTQAGPPTPSEETTGRANSAAEHHCLHCGMPSPFLEVVSSNPGGSPVNLRPTTSQSDADWCQPHGEHLEATQVKPAAHVYTFTEPPVNLRPTTSQPDADWCQPHGEHLEATQVEPAAHFYTATEPCQVSEFMVIGPPCFEFTQRGIRSTWSSGNDDPGEPGNMGVGNR